MRYLQICKPISTIRSDDSMTDLEKFQRWIRTYPGAANLTGLQVDYTDRLPGQFGIFPAGLTELSRTTDLLGNTTVQNQYNFALYVIFEKSPGDDIKAQINADWVMDFQRWVQTESVMHRAPIFGNIDQRKETMRAQSGTLYECDDEGLAMYVIQLSSVYKLYFKEENEWLT